MIHIRLEVFSLIGLVGIRAWIGVLIGQPSCAFRTSSTHQVSCKLLFGGWGGGGVLVDSVIPYKEASPELVLPPKKNSIQAAAASGNKMALYTTLQFFFNF